MIIWQQIKVEKEGSAIILIKIFNFCKEKFLSEISFLVVHFFILLWSALHVTGDLSIGILYWKVLFDIILMYCVSSIKSLTTTVRGPHCYLHFFMLLSVQYLMQMSTDWNPLPTTLTSPLRTDQVQEMPIKLRGSQNVAALCLISCQRENKNFK